jgi:two-component system, NarL family, nitrate/nitrite sensor histidine kinase NarX
VLGGMVSDLDSLNEELSELYEDMDSRVSRHTTRLAQKTASLKILYDVAASINQAQNLEELLLRFLRVLKEMVNGMTAVVRLEQPDGTLRIVGSIGVDNEILREREMLPLALCVCGKTLTPGRPAVRQPGPPLRAPAQAPDVRARADRDGIGAARLPRRTARHVPPVRAQAGHLRARGHHRTAADHRQPSRHGGGQAALRPRGAACFDHGGAHHAGPRTARFAGPDAGQPALPGAHARRPAAAAARPRGRSRDAQRIRAGLDEAHTELRELLNSFRAPVDQRGLVAALEKLVERFGRETGIHVLFQNQCREPDLSSAEEMQMLRVAQECLANIRKHAQAHTVRVMLGCGANGTYSLLVEDDGVGFEDSVKEGNGPASTSGCRSWRSGRGGSAAICGSRARSARGRGSN